MRLRSDRVRKPCAIVPPKGPDAARSGSTWIYWSSSVVSAKESMRDWSTSIQFETPISSPIRAA